MSASDSDIQPDAETLEHLLGIVVENRDKRCAELREQAGAQAKEIVGQAHARSRAHMHRHITALREKHRVRVASAMARNQTLLRQQHQKADRALLDVAWPLLRETMQALWQHPETRRKWLDAAATTAASRLRHGGASIEHPSTLPEQDIAWLVERFHQGSGKPPKCVPSADFDAGIRIRSHGTVIDATLEGLLKRRSWIEAALLARVEQGQGADG